MDDWLVFGKRRDMAGLIGRIARSITARSQIVKRCVLNDGMCNLSVEESLYVEGNGYNYSSLNEDVDGFMTDVERELSPLGVHDFNRGNVMLRVENDLLVMVYERGIVKDDFVMEKIKTNEWIIEE